MMIKQIKSLWYMSEDTLKVHKDSMEVCLICAKLSLYA